MLLFIPKHSLKSPQTNLFPKSTPPPMGNSALHRLSSATGRVILSDGAIFTYDKPLTVAELMLEHPQEVVVEFHTIINGKKPTPLPADQELDMKKIYLMLPIRKGKPAPLSSEEAQKLLIKTNYLLKLQAQMSYTGFLPLFARICPVVGSKNDGVSMVKEEEEEDEKRIKFKSDCFTEILEGRPEFLSRQISGKGWKPSLDTIREKAIKAKARHWIFETK